MWAVCPFRRMSMPKFPGTYLCHSVSLASPFVSYCLHHTNCFDAYRTDVAFKLAHGHLSRGLWGNLFPCTLSDGTSAAQVADFSADTHVCACETGCCTEQHFCCMGMASSLERINVCGPCSASTHCVGAGYVVSSLSGFWIKKMGLRKGKRRNRSEVKSPELKQQLSGRLGSQNLFFTPALTSYPLCWTVPLFF